MLKEPARGNVPVVSRRNILAGLALASASGAPAVADMTVPRDRHQQWLDDFRAVNDAWCEAEEDSAEDKRLWALREELEALLCQTLAYTREGLAAQMEWLLEDANDYWGTDNHREVAENVTKMLLEAAA